MNNRVPKLSPFFLLIFILQIQINSPFHWDGTEFSFDNPFIISFQGNIVYDLETNTQSDFAIEAAEWFLSSYVTPGVKSYKCNNDYVLGGSAVMGGGGLVTDPPTGQYFERVYSSVPIHNQIYIQLQFFQIDTWDTNTGQLYGDDHFDIAIDGNVIYGWALSMVYSGTYPLCGIQGYRDFVFTVTLTYPHSASSLTFRMISNANEYSGNESLGFRDLKIEFLTNTSPYFSLCAPGVTSSYLSDSRCQTSCTSSGNSITSVGYGFCFPTSSCSTNCRRCSDTTSTCTCCQTGSYLIDTTCYPACDYPLTTKTLGGVIYCETPCSGQYVWWDQSCSASCSYTTTYGSSAIVGKTVNTFLECTYPCATNEYLSWNISCLSSCPGPLITTTYKGRNFCEYPCASSEFLYWNGSCLSTCDSPLTSETQGNPQQRKFCWYTCSEAQFLYWNGSCLNTCPSPLSSETQGNTQQRQFCWYTCSETQYLYWNGSCLSTCPSPLSSEIQGITQKRNFCWFPCQPSEYLYWNQSCIKNCPIPLLSFDLSKNLFCFLPCDMPTIYWYQDFSCRKECSFPYNFIIHNSVDQCLKPCSKSSEWFYDLEEECHDTCDPPYVRQIINTIKVCHITRSTLTSETNKIKSTVDLIETLGKITSAILKVASIPQLSTPRSALLIQLSSLIQYIRYMRIKYPWRVQMLFQSNGPELISLSFDFSIPNKIQDQFDNYPLPYVFERYSLDSNFVNNMWDLLNTFLLVVFGIFALLGLRKILKKSLKANHLITRIIQSLRWNILIAMICGGSGEIIFYASLHVRNTPLTSSISIISFLISLLMISWVGIILGICCKILRGFRLQKQKITPSIDAAPPSEAPDWLEKWKGYEILYEDIEEKSLFSLAYMLIYVTRGIISFAILANLYDYPLTQSILMNIINLFIFTYLLYYKPLKDTWATTQLFINEILGIILTICVLALAIMDQAEIQARDSRETMGNVIIIIMLIFYILGVVFLVIEGVLFGIEAYKTWKEMRARGIKNPLEMIKILLFGEAKTHPEKIALELTENSSRMDTTTIHTQRENLKKLENQNSEIKGRNSSIISDAPLNSSTKFFIPTRRLNPTGIQLTESDTQNTEYEIETSRFHKPIRRTNQNETLSNGMNSYENTSGLILPEPNLQSNANIQNRRNLKVRMKRFNQSLNKVHWSNE